MTFFKLYFLAAVLFSDVNVRAVHAGGNVPNHVSHCSQPPGDCYENHRHNSCLKTHRFRDVVINEIMADPSPPVALPEAEFIELLNTSGHSIDISGWTLSDPKSTAVIPPTVIEPDEVIILCKNGQQDLFTGFGKTIALTNWPALNNSGDQLILGNADSTAIDEVNYSDDWYGDNQKSKGGWSLEQINPLTPCSGNENWRASENPAGGTPGRQNAVVDATPDLSGPEIIDIIVKNPQRITIGFNEKINARVLKAGNFDISPENQIQSIEYAQSYAQNLEILFINALQPNTLHTLEANNITDCAGNLIRKEKSSFQFVLAVRADSMDVIINEVLFNPRPGGKDFVELYNRSQNYVNLKSWQLINSQAIAENPGVATIVCDMVMGPGQYLVLTEDMTVLKADYPFGNEENYYEAQDMPTLPDDQGNVTVRDSIGKIIDAFDYSELYHLSLIKDLNGVSLERLSPLGPTNSKDNWHSAAGAIGYATPGYENSQKLPEAVSRDQVFIEPKIFVPGNDGVRDFTSINYQFDKNGYLLSIFIYDINGRQVKEIANNELVGANGFYQWNGTNQANLLVNPGYYIALIDILDPGGENFKIKKTVIVARDF